MAAGLSACSNVEKSYNYYYKFGYALEEGESDVLETYRYTVSAEPNQNDGIVRIEGTGFYDVTIRNTAPTKYKVETLFTFSGSYVARDGAGGEQFNSGTFNDSISGEAEFTVFTDTFSVSSFNKTFNKTVITNTKELKKYNYRISGTYEGGYSSQLEDIPLEGDEGLRQLLAKTDKNSDFSAEISGRYADNETFFLMLRLQDITSSFADSFYVAEPFEAVTPIKQWSIKAVYDADKPVFLPVEGVSMTGFSAAEFTEGVRCMRLDASLNDRLKGQDVVMYFSETLKYNYKRADGSATGDMNISLLMQFKQESLTFTLSQYQNFAVKAD